MQTSRLQYNLRRKGVFQKALSDFFCKTIAKILYIKNKYITTKNNPSENSDKGVHSLRHTFVTRAIECGMDVKTLSEILVHKNATITLNRYAHSLWEHKSEMMNKLCKLL
ncbi:MAG: tyrosine-type recombinase/integrase [Eubacteriales bacterium]|nr:tyrosine-type recombinase/integrase [Christensenellaceae bacterium]MDD7092807.1 tyrosine-type recombinase/integrase [Christensenellaceae bacterium]MDY3241034.1 tyrosine-type recombinase/integrase [Eubacteriales bacterium]MDY4709878.1 tyrosine-type recombinase/integrase [Eubacteriales bacterium]